MVNVCGISAAESNRVSLRYIEEDDACWSVTPLLGVTRELRVTSSSLTANKETQISEEIRADRMVSNIIEVGASSGGDIEGEFSVGTYDDFFQAFLGGTWTRVMGFDRFAGASVAWTSTSVLTISGGDFTDYFTVGQVVKTEGFLEDVNNTYKTISTKAFTGGNTVLTMTTTTAIVEVGNPFVVVMDANDLIVRSTAIRIGTVAQQIDSNSSDAFAAAITAGDLVIGQRIAVEGLGYENATLVYAGLPVDGQTFVLNDGARIVTFEYDGNGAFTRGNVPVLIGANIAEMATNTRMAINGALNEGKTSCFCSDDGIDTATITNTRKGADGVLTTAATNVTRVDFTGDTASFGVFTITGLTDDTITVAEPIVANANAGGLVVSIKGSHLRNPGDLTAIKRRSFTIETAFNDVNQYFLQTGLRVGSFTLGVAAGEIVTTQFALEGKETSTSGVTTLNAAPYDPIASTSTEVLNATVNIGEVRKNGALLTTGIQAIEINGDAGLRMQPGISSRFPIGIGLGRFNLTGSMQAYFETLDLYDNFLAHDTISLAFDFQDNSGNFMTFTLPAVKIMSDPVAPGGIDQDIIEEIEFGAQRDPILNTMMMIDRMSSLAPAMV